MASPRAARCCGAGLPGFALLFLALLGLVSLPALAAGGSPDQLNVVTGHHDPGADYGSMLEAPRLSVNQVYWSPDRIPISKCAYVAVFHQDGSEHDLTQLTQLRLLAKTLRLTQTKAELLVLVSQNTLLEHRQQLTAAGYRVLPVPEVVDVLHAFHQDAKTGAEAAQQLLALPAATRKALEALDVAELERLRDCERSLKKLYLWSLTDYERVIFLDSSLLVMLNLDELFLCGDYCMFFHSWVYYHSDLFVVKPSMAMFNRLLSQMALLNAHRKPTLMTADSCSDAFEAVYIPVLGDLEAAPLFDPADGQQIGRPLQRLQMNYCLNVMFFYEYFSWHLLQLAQFRHLTIPGFTITWPSWKPTFWPMAWYFDVHWEYNNWRQALLGGEAGGESYVGFALLHLVLAGLVAWGVTEGMGQAFAWAGRSGRGGSASSNLGHRAVLREASGDASATLLNRVRGVAFVAVRWCCHALRPIANEYIARRCGIALLGMALGLNGLFWSALLVYKLVLPAYAPPHLALPLWFLYTSLLSLGWFHFTCLLLFPLSDPEFCAADLVEHWRQAELANLQAQLAYADLLSARASGHLSPKAAFRAVNSPETEGCLGRTSEIAGAFQTSPVGLRRYEVAQRQLELQAMRPRRLPPILPFPVPGPLLAPLPRRLRLAIQGLSVAPADAILPPQPWIYDRSSRFHFYVRNFSLPFFMLATFLFLTVSAYRIHFQFGQKIGFSMSMLTFVLFSFCAPFFRLFAGVSNLPSPLPSASAGPASVPRINTVGGGFGGADNNGAEVISAASLAASGAPVAMEPLGGLNRGLMAGPGSAPAPPAPLLGPF